MRIVTMVWHDFSENPLDLPKRTAWYVCKIKSSDNLRVVYGYENITPEHYDSWAMIKKY